MSYPGLTDRQRLKVLAVTVALGLVAFAEVVRLRYLSGNPTRS